MDATFLYCSGAIEYLFIVLFIWFSVVYRVVILRAEATKALPGKSWSADWRGMCQWLPYRHVGHLIAITVPFVSK